MSSLIKCDICGKTGCKSSDFIHLNTYHMFTITRYEPDSFDSMEICTECYKKIFKTRQKGE